MEEGIKGEGLVPTATRTSFDHPQQRPSSWAWRRAWDTRRHDPSVGSPRHWYGSCSHPLSLLVSLLLLSFRCYHFLLSYSRSFILSQGIAAFPLPLPFLFEEATHSGGKNLTCHRHVSPSETLKPFRYVSRNTRAEI